MRIFTLALLQTAFDAAHGAMRATFRVMTGEAVERGASLVVLPEFSLSPYFAAVPDATVVPELIPSGPSCLFFADLARENQCFLVGSLYETTYKAAGAERFDTAVIFAPDGSLIGAQRKQHIPADIGYYERDYFGPANGEYPVFALPFAQVAAPTCYDQWFPELARIPRAKGSGTFSLSNSDWVGAVRAGV